jgi:hypothetical protein
MARPDFYLHIDGLDGLDRHLDFDKKIVRKGMRAVGKVVEKDAKQRVARSGVSAAGENPGKQKGLLYRSIRAKVSRSGFLVRIAPQKIAGMKSFYPAFLWYGVKRNRKRNRRPRRGQDYIIAPRNNFMTDALGNQQDKIKEILLATLHAAVRVA